MKKKREYEHDTGAIHIWQQHPMPSSTCLKDEQDDRKSIGESIHCFYFPRKQYG